MTMIVPLAWWFWLVLAIVFFIIEIISPSVFFFACLGVGSLLTMFVSLATANLAVLWSTFFISSVILVLVSQPLAKKIAKRPVRLAGVDSLIGQKALVIEPIDPVTKKGMVKVEGEQWVAESDENITKDEWVTITEAKGTKLVVKK